MFPPISNQQSAFALENGFSKWKRTEKLKLHENGPNHRKAFLSWKDLEKRIRLGETIDDESEQQILAEKNKWCEVLKRIVSTIRLVASQNLAFREHREISQEHQNPGNFLAVLKYLSEYDPLMAQHLSTAFSKPGSTSYLSPNIQNELIVILGAKIQPPISPIESKCH